MTTNELIPLWGIYMVALLVTGFVKEGVSVLLMVVAGSLVMGWVNRTEVDTALVVERMTQGAGVMMVLATLTMFVKQVVQGFLKAAGAK